MIKKESLSARVFIQMTVTQNLIINKDKQNVFWPKFSRYNIIAHKK